MWLTGLESHQAQSRGAYSRQQGSSTPRALSRARARSEPRALEGLWGPRGDAPPTQRPPGGLPMPSVLRVPVVARDRRGRPDIRGPMACGGKRLNPEAPDALMLG